ncbi:MAG: hypothetical protein ACJAT6_000306 [Akkermansiaceae bacterium]
MLASDVSRLIELTAKLHAIEIPLSSTRELDEPCWYQETHQPSTCRSVAIHAKMIDEADHPHSHFRFHRKTPLL